MSKKTNNWFAGIIALVCFVGLLALLQMPQSGLFALAQASSQTEEKRSVPPLVLTPELLQETLPEASEEEKAAEKGADNFACFVCHGNLKGEELVTIHAREGYGCVKCHGPSEAHRNDEDNITPPDIMYPPEAIEPACKKCHETHDAAAEKVIARYLERCPDRSADELVCTDCHGHHRLTRRVVRWDKRTGKLLPPPGQQQAEGK